MRVCYQWCLSCLVKKDSSEKFPPFFSSSPIQKKILDPPSKKLTTPPIKKKLTPPKRKKNLKQNNGISATVRIGRFSVFRMRDFYITLKLRCNFGCNCGVWFKAICKTSDHEVIMSTYGGLGLQDI